MKAFLTGSRAYGTPTSKSDYDIVLAPDCILETIMQDFQVRHVYREGRVNFILCRTELEWAVWRLGTEALIQIKDQEKRAIPREEATDYFLKLARSVGLRLEYPSGDQ